MKYNNSHHSQAQKGLLGRRYAAPVCSTLCDFLDRGNMKAALLIALFYPAMAWSDPYSIVQVQGVSGRHGLDGSDSLMVNIGIGYEFKGLYIDWDVGMNAEVPFDDVFNINDNQQKAHMSLMTGYLLKVMDNNYIKFGAGSKAAIFDENCYYYYVNEEVCERKEEYGPTYRVGYFRRIVGHGYVGLDLSSDELSKARKYGALSLTFNNNF